MTREEAATMRLANQQLTFPRFEKPEDVVDWMGMVQAQEYNQFRWAIAMRTIEPKIDALKESFSSGKILRLHLFRCTVQAVTPQDYLWMHGLCRERNLQAEQSWMRSLGLKLPEQFFLEGMDALKEILSGGLSLSKDIIGEKLAEIGLPTEKRLLRHLLLHSEIEGVICSGTMTGKDPIWALTSEWIRPTNNQTAIAGNEAAAMLARKYFRSHSPASIEDFCWWSGLPVGQLRKGIEAIASELVEVEVDGEKMYAWKEGLACAADNVAGQCCLLPPYDEYLIGYKSRWVSLDKKHKDKAHNNSGIFHPVVLFNGQVVGNWKTVKMHGVRRVDVEFFCQKRAVGKKRIESAIASWQNAQSQNNEL